MGPTWGPPGSCRPQMGPMLVTWTLLSGVGLNAYQLCTRSMLYIYNYKRGDISLVAFRTILRIYDNTIRLVIRAYFLVQWKTKTYGRNRIIIIECYWLFLSLQLVVTVAIKALVWTRSPLQMCDMNHENVNGFVGICIDRPNICIVTQYWPRGSLQVSLIRYQVYWDVLRRNDMYDLEQHYSNSSALAIDMRFIEMCCVCNGVWTKHTFSMDVKRHMDLE